MGDFVVSIENNKTSTEKWTEQDIDWNKNNFKIEDNISMNSLREMKSFRY